MTGLGGMISFVLEGAAAAAAVVNRLAMFAIAPSLGGLESIVTQPVTTTHHGLDPDKRAAPGIADNMIRLSVGLEDPGDLIRTWTRAPERPCSEHPGRSRRPGRRRLRAAARSPGPAVHTDRADAAGLGGPLDRSCRQADGARPAAPPRPRSRRDHWAPAIPMDETEVVPVLVDIATGLQDLHSTGIIHRDLKPANVLRHEGRWKLADFGIARDQEIGTQDPTFVGWGSLPYMAPELWELRSPTVKTDLYALGCLGYELLAGAPPYTGDQAALREGHITQVPPEAPCGDVVLKSLIGRLMAKRPEDRPQDARAVLDRLRRALVPRGPVQESIARGLGAHAAEQARGVAEQSAAQAAEDARRQQIAQAKADLREIVNDALSDLRAVEPDVTSDERGTAWSGFVATPGFSLAAGGVWLRIDLWEGMTTSRPVPGDTMVLAGCVMITNPSYTTELNAANLVYEQAGDRLTWQIYRFRNSIGPPDKYRYGPYGRTHGLRHGEFLDPRERAFMLRPVMHVWTKAVTTLTAESLLELFQEAVDLRPPDPRTGIW